MSRAGAVLLAALALMVALALFFAPPAPEKRALAPQAATRQGVVWQEGLALIDINRADQALLCALPGIGSSLSERILADRLENGPYESLSDLQRVPGIGPAKIAAIAPRATAGP